MTHRFPIKEIARQAGLGTATIDRVINNRSHVSPQTHARVQTAIAELQGQEAQLAARGRRMFFDFVIEAPLRFSREVQIAAENTVTQIGAAVCRPRFLTREVMTQAEVVKALARIAKRGSQGVCLKARDLPAIRESVEDLANAGIPVVTLVTDIRTTGRIAYVGLNNKSAGQTAAYLIETALGLTAGTVLVTRSNNRFWGEEEREVAFMQKLRRSCPNLKILDVSGGSGVHSETTRIIDNVIDRLTDIRAVYSIGGGNRAILDCLDRGRLSPDIYIAHDLDRDNRALLQKHRIGFVLHHDLATDLKNVFHAFLQHHQLLAGDHVTTTSHFQVITPLNVP